MIRSTFTANLLCHAKYYSTRIQAYLQMIILPLISALTLTNGYFTRKKGN